MTETHSRRYAATISLAYTALLLGACRPADEVDDTASAQSSVTTAPDRVAYASWRPGAWDIYRITSPDTPPERLTTHPDLDYDPVVSSDGRFLVFTSERRGNPDLYVQDLQAAEAPL